MYQRLILIIQRLLKPVCLCILVLTAAGCATVSSDEIIPKSLTLPANIKPFIGTVQVNVALDVESIHVMRPRELVNPDLLAAYFNVSKDDLWKAIALKDVEIGWFYADLRQNQYMVAFSNLKMGTNTFGRLRRGANSTVPYAMTGEQSRVYGTLIKEAMEKSIVSHHLFSGIVQDRADYVLDVWVDRINHQQPALGFGEYSADFYSIWRLIRVRDRKVLACDFALGHGIFAESGFGPTQHSYHAAMRDLIDKGFAMLFDGSREHLNALIPTGINRPGRGSILPEGADQWNDNIRRNWHKLHVNMTPDEVESAIGPIRIGNNAWDRHYILPVRFNPSPDDPLQGLGEMDFIEYKTNLYSLVFISAKEYKRPVLFNVPRLLLWKLIK